jgi:hypothetical protein
MVESHYTTIYSMDDEYKVRQASCESASEYIIMERSIDELLECERDEAQLLLAEVTTDYDR